MKKRLLTLLVAVTVALSLFSGFSVMASGDGYVEFYTTDGVSIDEMTTETAVSATVNFTTAKKTAAKVIAAHYLTNGKLTKFQTVDTVAIETADVTETTKSYTIDVTDTELLKIFVWDGFSSISPLLKNAGVIARKVYTPTTSVEVVNGAVAEAVTLSAPGVTADVPEGVVMAEGATALSLTVTALENSNSGIQVEENQQLNSLDVHVEGVSANNTTPIIITVEKAAEPGYNKGNLILYHIENGETVKMTEVENVADLTAHNQFTYDPATGDITLALCTFSEIALVSDTEQGWEGEIDTSWYNTTDTEFVIANADQLAGFGAIVGGMNGQTQDSFEGKTVTLISDINIGDKETENNPDIIFYPIGYNSSDGKYEKTGEAITSGFYSFNGTFDGNGHTISNIYQNTWEMKGDNEYYAANLQYYRDGMGLFGKLYGATVKNLTVDNFSSDGEYTTTGVIATYADSANGKSATFENIAITNCNPRVYNIGNGGIVGIGGWYSKDDADLVNTPIIFRNITVDNTNKISALWGSWDVACAGIMGRYYPNTTVTEDSTPKLVTFENCHVGAQIDVFNDVCGNYQYYWYRYAGMMIGTVQASKEEGGYTVPDMTGVTAENCTVHFGDWNNYWYCELVANSIASYTHDHQFSRLTVINDVSEIQDEKGNWNQTGNFGIIADAENNIMNKCFHIVKDAEGNLVEHTHEAGGYETTDIDGDGVVDSNVLKEDKQRVYLPFKQLFQGPGWGVKNIPIYDNEEENVFSGVTILDREIADSKIKFKTVLGENSELYNKKEYKLSELFTAAEINDEKLVIKPENVQVTVSPVDEADDVSATYVADTADWTNGTLTFSGKGAATVTITDYYFCTPTTITVSVTERQPEEKFDLVFENTETYMYRVGNQNTVTLGNLFKAREGAEIGTVEVTVEPVDNTGASGTYTSNATWTNGTIQFSGTGIVKVIITDNDYCTPTELFLEVVDAVNTTSALNATSYNVVLLGNIGSGFEVSGDYTFYGNGFTLNYTGNGQYLNNGLKQGIVTVKENGALDNLRIEASIYPNAYMYYSSASIGKAVTSGQSDGANRYYYQLSAIAASGNATISNCYVYGGRNNIFVNTGDVTIENSVLECGVVANVQIQSNSSHNVTFENVTTIQHQINATMGETENVMMGAGIIVGPETNDNPIIVLNGDFKQYNWVTSDDYDAVDDEAAKKIIEAAVNATAFNHTVNGKTASNLGIIYMNEEETPITNNTVLPYAFGTVSISGVTGKVYSLQGATESQIYYDYANADKSTVNGIYKPQFKLKTDLGGQYIENTDGCDEYCYVDDKLNKIVNVMFPSGDSKELDLASMVDINKYTGQDLNLEISCVDDGGNDVAITDNKITLSAAGEYTVTYAVTDTVFYDKDGESFSDIVKESWDVTVSVSLKDNSVPNAYFEFDSTKQTMGYAKKSLISGGQTQYLPFLAGLKIYDYIGQNAYLRFDGDNDFSKIAAAEITGYTSANHVLIKVTLTDGGVINIDTTARAASGGSTYTGKLQTSGNTLYYVNDGTTSATTTTWVISNYSFTGNNGVEIDSGTVTFANCENGSVPTGTFVTTISYTVSYDANGGNCGQTTGYATSASSSVTLPTPTRSGYIFAGWYTAASGGTRVGDAGASYIPASNITLYAQWGKPSTVTYDANGGNCDTTSQTYTGTALTLPEATRSGYTLIGWFTAPNGGNLVGKAKESYNPTENVTLYAQWSQNYTVTYNANGGSCDTVTQSYTGTALTLPEATSSIYNFAGWYTEASGGEKVGDTGESYTPTANITLYAHWTPKYTVTYDTNGGSCTIASDNVDQGKSIELPTPTRTGYTFNGWYTATSGGSKIGDAGADYTPTADITLYAQWTINSYTITVTTSNATVTDVTNGESKAYGTIVSVTVSFDKNNSKTLTVINGNTGATILSKSAAGTYTFTMPDSDVTINASSSGTCVTGDTLITLADGSQKRIDAVTSDDLLKVWDFENGEYTTVSSAVVRNHGYDNNTVITLEFDDGTVTKAVNEHGYFDLDINKFVAFNAETANDYIGHKFVKEDGDGYTAVTLTNCTVEDKYTEAYSILSAYHYNFITDRMFSLTSSVGGLDFFMPFEIGENLTIDAAKKQADIEKYGLYTYEELAEYLTYEEYIALNAAYIKVSVGKGIITHDEFIRTIKIEVRGE